MRNLAAGLSVIMLMLVGCSSDGGGNATPPNNGGQPGSGNPPANPMPIEPTSALFVVGDSLSDVGNAAAMADFLLGRTIDPPTVGLCSPTEVLVLTRQCDDLFHKQSRVTDGPVAVEHLSAHLGFGELEPSMHLVPGRPLSGTNYAIASAKARTGDPEDLATQVDLLLIDHAPLAADALYVIMIGGNDAIDALQVEFDGPGSSAETPPQIVTAAVAAIGTVVERLLDFGARRFIIVNVPDLAALPRVRNEALASGREAAVLAAASAISADFDRELGTVLDAIEARGLWDSPRPPVIARFDLSLALNAAQLKIEGDGGNVVDACFDSDVYRDSVTAERLFHPDCEPLPGNAPAFNDFAFWDGIHPTGAAHALVGSALIELL